MGLPGGNNKGFLWMDKPDIPKPKAPPPPIDQSKVYFRELARAATNRQLKQSSGRGGAFMSGFESYRAPGSKSTLG